MKHWLLVVVGIFLSLGGFAVGVFQGEAWAGWGGALTAAVAFLFPFLPDPVVDQLLEGDAPRNSLRPGVTDPRPDLESNRARRVHSALLRMRNNPSTRRCVAIVGILGTAMWAFGDYAAAQVTAALGVG